MRISDWSSDVCSSDLAEMVAPGRLRKQRRTTLVQNVRFRRDFSFRRALFPLSLAIWTEFECSTAMRLKFHSRHTSVHSWMACRSEEHTSELQPLMRISYVFICLINKISAYTISAFRKRWMI